MKTLSNIFAYSGLFIILAAFAFIPFTGQSNLFTFIFIIIGTINILTSLFFYKKASMEALNQQLETTVQVKDLDIKTLDYAKLSIEQAEKLRKEQQQTQTFAIVCFVITFVLFQTVIVPLITIPLGIYFILKSRRQKWPIKAWIAENKIKLPNLENIRYIQPELRDNLYNIVFVKKLFIKYTKFPEVELDDVFSFTYKGKGVELIELKWKSNDDKEKNRNTFVCLATKNPDRIEGQTVAWSDKSWHFDLPQKVRTESIVFEKTFQTLATDQMFARMHLKTNVMQDMIDFNNSLATRNSVFYFDQDMMYIIFRATGDALEPDLSKPLTFQLSQNDTMLQDLQFALKVFDDFWLDRKVNI